MKVRCFLFSFLIMSILQDNAYCQLLKSIETGDARLFTTDETGNVYVVRANNELVRYNRDGDSTGSFRSVQNGDITSVDATNPLRLLIGFQSFSKITLLDRMLTPKNELDLKKLGIFNPSATGISADGKIWVYDYVNARLKKIDDQLNIVLSSNDMRLESQTVPNPLSLVERDYKVYLSDTAQGIYVFDRYGGFINTIEIKSVAKMQVIGAQIVYRTSDTLFSYDQKSLLLKQMPLPQDHDNIRDVRLERNRMYILYNSKLDIYYQEN